jgi:hypothetical protein
LAPVASMAETTVRRPDRNTKEGPLRTPRNRWEDIIKMDLGKSYLKLYVEWTDGLTWLRFVFGAALLWQGHVQLRCS